MSQRVGSTVLGSSTRFPQAQPAQFCPAIDAPDDTTLQVLPKTFLITPPRAKTMIDDDCRDGGDEEAVLDGRGALVVARRSWLRM